MTTLNGYRKQSDDRNDLVFEFLRFVRALRPKAVMMENVPGLESNNRIGKIFAALKSLGYVANSGIFDAAAYGVPQRRERFILVAGKGEAIPFGRRAKKTRTVRDAFSSFNSKRLRNDPLHTLPETRNAKVQKLIRMIPHDGGSRVDLPSRHQLKCHRKCDGFKDVYGRMAWDSVAPTITGGCCNPSKGRFLHPTKNRAITLREAALLQSFPTTYRFSLRRGKFPAAQMIGNALPPEFIRRHALPIRRFVETLV